MTTYREEVITSLRSGQAVLDNVLKDLNNAELDLWETYRKISEVIIDLKKGQEILIQCSSKALDRLFAEDTGS